MTKAVIDYICKIILIVCHRTHMVESTEPVSDYLVRQGNTEKREAAATPFDYTESDQFVMRRFW